MRLHSYFLSPAVVLLTLPVTFAQERSLDGSGNNPNHPEWGVAGSPYVRLDYGPGTPNNAYADGVGAEARPNAANVRAISNVLGRQAELRPEPLGLNDIAAWWLFHVHTDIALGFQNSPGNPLVPAPPGEAVNPGEPAPLQIPAGDVPFDPNGTGTVTMPFNRSISTFSFGIPTPAREILNFGSSFQDLDSIYQSNPVDHAALRTHRRGRIVLQPVANGERVVPSVGFIQAQAPGAFATLPPFAAVAGGGFPTGAALQTMIMREHNRVARRLDALDPARKRAVGLPALPAVGPEAYDKAVFDLSRAIVEAEVQAITYNEVLPAIGVRLPAYAGYDGQTYPGVLIEFATGPFRVHSMVSKLAQRLGPDGESIPAGPADSTLTFVPGFTYAEFSQEGMDATIRGMLRTPAQAHDLKFDEGIRSVGFPLSLEVIGALNDLFATHIKRGRDRGLPSYGAIRAALGLGAVEGFDDITPRRGLQRKLAEAYPGGVDNIDPIVGMLAEPRVRGSLFGRTALELYKRQFRLSRDTDRFWHEKRMAESGTFRRALAAAGLSPQLQDGCWTLSRCLAGLILDTTSVGRAGDVVRLRRSSNALLVH